MVGFDARLSALLDQKLYRWPSVFLDVALHTTKLGRFVAIAPVALNFALVMAERVPDLAGVEIWRSPEKAADLKISPIDTKASRRNRSPSLTVPTLAETD